MVDQSTYCTFISTGSRGKWRNQKGDITDVIVKTVPSGMVSWTEDRGPEPRSVAWTPREKLLGAGDELPRFESDVYSLGMTIIEAMTQEPPFGVMDDEEIIDKIIIGEHYPKPKEATDDEWSLISQLCAVHMEDRISLEEAIDEIYKLQRREINFPVESLEGSPSSRKLLASITAKCERIPENEKLFRRLLERLERLHIAVAPLAAEDQRKKQYVDITLLFLQLVKYKPLLERLAKCEIVRERIFHLQLRLTEVGKEVNVAELSTWIEDWDDDCEDQFSKLSQLVANSSERGLVKGLCGKKEVQEALFALKRSIGKRGQSVEMKQLKEATYARVEAYSNQAGLHLFDWFISRDEIEYNDEVIEAEGLETVLGVACGLRYIHACGIVHGDVSPNNILVSGAGTAKLASFVLSSPQREIEPEPTQSGSSSWTSPAFCCGHRRSFASDVFWFGKMIFELVSGSIATNNIDFRCDICSAIDLPPQPAVFTDDEWELVLDTCKGGVTWLTLLNASLALLLSMQQLMRSSREIQGKLDRAAPAKANDELGNLAEDSSPFAWSLVPHGLTINGNDLVGKGAFGCVEEGIWLGAAVAVKKLAIKGPGEVRFSSKKLVSGTVPSKPSTRREHVWCLLPRLLRPHFGLCQQGQLDTYLKKEPHYSQVWGLLYDAALGLQWLQFRGIIHADLKCNNIVVTASGRVKLIDYGLSRVRTCRGFRSGDALPWKAPECLIRGSESSFASDVYSFGMCVVEAVSGDFPWGKTRVAHAASSQKSDSSSPMRSRSRFFAQHSHHPYDAAQTPEAELVHPHLGEPQSGGKTAKAVEKMDDLYKLMSLEHMQSMAEFRVEFHRMADQGFQELARCAESIDVIREVILTDEWREGLVAMASVAKQEESRRGYKFCTY
ncbi:Protein kinase, ATP binding site [Phytophthora cactorum]|nr:Protein kinase, ATP binding site [Phytophthora cactorum]